MGAWSSDTAFIALITVGQAACTQSVLLSAISTLANHMRPFSQRSSGRFRYSDMERESFGRVALKDSGWGHFIKIYITSGGIWQQKAVNKLSMEYVTDQRVNIEWGPEFSLYLPPPVCLPSSFSLSLSLTFSPSLTSWPLRCCVHRFVSHLQLKLLIIYCITSSFFSKATDRHLI